MPPPKPSKKKSKSSKSTAKEASRLSNVGRDLDGQMFQLSREWETSSQRKALVQQIQDEIIPRENIVLENAICLGLGSLEKAAMGSLPGWSNTTSIIDRDEVLDKSLGPLLDDNLPRFRPVGKGQRRNFGLHQLLVFETVMTCLRKKFDIGLARFQDPEFTPRDEEFLVERASAPFTNITLLNGYKRGAILVEAWRQRSKRNCRQAHAK